MQLLTPAFTTKSVEGACRKRSKRGFTLVETMVATVLLSMIILGILQVMIGSYRVAAKARINDHARYVVKSMADEFLTQFMLNSSGFVLPLFQPTVDGSGNLTPLGTGLTWTNSDGSQGTLSADTLGLYFYVLLNDNTGAPVVGTVTRTVQYVYSSSGSETLVTQNQPAGYMLQGDFTISYPYLGSTLSQTISVVRSIP